MTFTLSPVFGWPATIAAIVILCGFTLFLALRAHAQRPDVDSSA